MAINYGGDAPVGFAVMTFCRTFGMTPLEYDEQPADVILSWYRYARLEGEAREMQGKIEQFKAGRR